MRKILQKLLDHIPEYTAFMTVEELDESSRRLVQAYPENVQLLTLGESTQGHPIYCLKIGDEDCLPQVGLMLGCPHPNEPVGTMMLEYLCEALARDKELREELGYTWYVVKAWDCDGLRLNEGWLKGPFTLQNYGANYFRPAGFQQVEWTFPIDYKNLHFHESIAETRAVMKLIEAVKPQFLYPLHNSSFGGVVWYVSDAAPDTCEALYGAAARQGIPLDIGEPEMPYAVAMGDAVYPLTTMRDEYEYMEAAGVEDPARYIRLGTSSDDYASRFGSVTALVTEVPYFEAKQVCDGSPGSGTRRQFVMERIAFEKEAGTWVRESIARTAGIVRQDDPYRVALEDYFQPEGYDVEAEHVRTDAAYDRTASVAEEFSSRFSLRFHCLCKYGMMVRMYERVLGSMDGADLHQDGEKQLLRSELELFQRRFDQLAKDLEAKISYTVIPIRNLVALQLESAIIMMGMDKRRLQL